MRHRIVAFTALALAILISGTHAQTLSGEYKLGVLEPLTGPLAF